MQKCMKIMEISQKEKFLKILSNYDKKVVKCSKRPKNVHMHTKNKKIYQLARNAPRFLSTFRRAWICENEMGRRKKASVHSRDDGCTITLTHPLLSHLAVFVLMTTISYCFTIFYSYFAAVEKRRGGWSPLRKCALSSDAWC